MRSAVLAIAIAATGCSASQAQEIGSASRGEKYVRERCSECHAVDRQTQKSPDFHAPRFEDAANTPGMTAMALAAWLNTSHKTMPNLIVKADELDDVIAFIRSLKSAQAAPN